jgi:hypothetical protein
MKNKLGLIQSRGMGDVIISLPIAHYYYKEGWEIHWPICQEFLPNLITHIPWINWIPMPTDNKGQFFYDKPMQLLTELNCDLIIPLYQALTSHPEFSQEPYFQHVPFDRYKYNRAGVPFLNKWQLKDCITRDLNKEQELYQKLVTQEQYVVVHLKGWDHRADFDTSIIPGDWQQIEITELPDYSIFDWIMVLEKAQSIIAVDSSVANLVDQLQIGDDLYFLPRSHIHLTPTLGQAWTWLENLNLNPNTKIFRTG